MKVSVLVPLYNEEKTIGIILEKLLNLPFVSEIVIVDDASTDGSADVVKSFTDTKICYHRLSSNSGKTAAINTALKMGTGDIFIIQDADLEYDPKDIGDVLAPILENKADVVYGSRFLVKKASRVLYFYHYLANKSLTFLSNLFTNLNMTDIETCYKAFRSDILREIDLVSEGFGMEVELTAIFAKMKLRIYEVPISYYGRTYEEGKKIALKDGFMALYYIFYFNLIYTRMRRVKKHFVKLTSS
ncbi:MAG: glycosyltransferase family 2 protein [Oligoflexia bacterium]|nr:glycosyltransferase family 2 protein [Oligoflexia bacterium]